MKYIKFIILLSFLSFFQIVQMARAENVQGIVAIVNDDAISVRDLQNRMILIMASSGLPNTDDVRAKLAPQVINNLIEEQLMLQEAAKLEQNIEPSEIETGFSTIATQNKMKSEDFKMMLQRKGVDISTMERQIRAQIAWGKVVQTKLRPQITISDRDVDDVLARLKTKIGTIEFLAAEIFLPAENPKQVKEAQQFAQKIVQEIKSGKASFFKLAQQFSKSAGANNGGDMGWLSEDQMDPEILGALKKISKNQVSTPVQTPAGVHVLFLRDTRTLSENSMPSRDQVYYNIGTQRLERLQRRHLMDVRAASFVDIRV